MRQRSACGARSPRSCFPQHTPTPPARLPKHLVSRASPHAVRSQPSPQHITEAVAVYRIIVPRASGAKRPRDVPQQTIHPYFALWHQWGDSGAAFTLALAALRAAGWLALRYQRPQKAAEGAAGGAPEKAKAKEKEGNKKGSGSREAPLRRAGRLAANAVGALFPLSLLGALVVL